LPSPPCSIAGATEQGIRIVSREKFRGGAGPRHHLDGIDTFGFKWSLPLVSIALSRLAVDCRFSGEIDHPNNGKHESAHEPDIMPGHALSSLARDMTGRRSGSSEEELMAFS
jgi:hypothetical protein